MLDLNTPLGAAVWIGYFILLLSTVFAGGQYLQYLLAGIFSVMMLVRLHFAPLGGDPHLSLTQREIGISALWLMAVLISQRNRMEASLRRTERTLRTISACDQTLVWANTESALLQEICQVIVKEGGYRLVWVCFAESDAQKSVRIAAHAGHDEGYLKELHLTWADSERGRGPTGTAIRSGQPVLCGSIATDPNFAPWCDKALKHGYASSLALPLLDGNRAFGALSIYAAKPDAFNAEEVELLTKLADDLAYGILALRRNLEQQKAEKVARASEENLNRAQAVAHIGSWHLDIRNDVLTWSAETHRMFGIQPGQPLTLESFLARIHPADREGVLQAWNAALRGARHDVEHRIVVGNETRWVRERAEISFDAQGTALEGIGTTQDITERKLAERQLIETLKFSRKIISDASMGIIVYQASGQCVLANQFAARTIDTTVPQLLKQNFRQLESWHASGMLRVVEEVLATGKPQQAEFHFTSTFGKELWLMCHFTPFVQGDQAHLLLLFNDIIGRKQAEEGVREKAALLDKAQDAIFVLDPDKRIMYWNKSAERIYGWTAAEAVGKSAVGLLFKGEMTPQLANTIKTVDERGEWVGELQEYTKDGKMVTVQARCNLMRDEQGRPKSRLIINTDITERKKLEIQFLRSQRMEGIGALAGGIAHDLNNVLTPLLFSVQVLKEKVTDEDGRKLLQALEANVQRGAQLVKQVLAFGRGVTGERIAVNPKHVVRDIKQIVHETFPKSVEFEAHAVADLWTITGDPTQLHQVLLNLCVNARDAMPKGGKLFIQMENMMFDETYAGMNPEAKVGPYVCIAVTDTGMGIPREIQSKIFDPFFTTKEPGKGTGLGLSTSLTIVKNHGGFIHCHSTPGKGSRFEVYFPANISRVVEDNAITEEFRLPRGHNELVLVVDDEEQIREIAQKTLERYGYHVLLAADGAEAVSLYTPRQKEISAVITDMVMPIMDGPATIVALKTINPDVKIVSSSGMASDGGMAKARDAGVRYFIPKPYTTATMLNTLYDVLNGKR